MNKQTKAKAIMDTLGVRELVTMDDVIIFLRTKLGDISGNIYTVKILSSRKPLTPFLEQEDETIDNLYKIIK